MNAVRFSVGLTIARSIVTSRWVSMRIHMTAHDSATVLEFTPTCHSILNANTAFSTTLKRKSATTQPTSILHSAYCPKTSFPQQLLWPLLQQATTRHQTVTILASTWAATTTALETTGVSTLSNGMVSSTTSSHLEATGMLSQLSMNHYLTPTGGPTQTEPNRCR